MTAQTVVARPDQVNLNLYAGDDFALDLTVLDPDGSPADLTGMTARADIRQNTGTPVLASFAATVAGNVVSLRLAAADAAVLPDGAVWDCQLAGIDTFTVAAGTVRTRAQVTT